MLECIKVTMEVEEKQSLEPRKENSHPDTLRNKRHHVPAWDSSWSYHGQRCLGGFPCRRGKSISEQTISCQKLLDAVCGMTEQNRTERFKSATGGQ